MSRDAERRLRRLRRLSELLDSAVRVPGTDRRVGLDALVGLVPGVGDALTALVSLLVVAEGYRLGASRLTLLRMLANVAVDYAVGSVPLAGDLFDAAWKANERNVRLLERELV